LSGRSEKVGRESNKLLVQRCVIFPRSVSLRIPVQSPKTSYQDHQDTSNHRLSVAEENPLDAVRLTTLAISAWVAHPSVLIKVSASLRVCQTRYLPKILSGFDSPSRRLSNLPGPRMSPASQFFSGGQSSGSRGSAGYEPSPALNPQQPRPSSDSQQFDKQHQRGNSGSSQGTSLRQRTPSGSQQHEQHQRKASGLSQEWGQQQSQNDPFTGSRPAAPSQTTPRQSSSPDTPKHGHPLFNTPSPQQ
jgi:hypothetical protein